MVKVTLTAMDRCFQKVWEEKGWSVTSASNDYKKKIYPEQQPRSIVEKKIFE